MFTGDATLALRWWRGFEPVWSEPLATTGPALEPTARGTSTRPYLQGRTDQGR